MEATKKIGVIAGSFDPVTLGHLWLIKKAFDLMDEVHVVMAVNASKKHRFSPEQRVELLRSSLEGYLGGDCFERLRLAELGNRLVVSYAKEVGAHYLLRGIRNGTDLDYEHQIQQVNRMANPNVETLYLFPPAELTAVSSSMVKNLVGIDDWEPLVAQFVSPSVLAAFQANAARQG